MSPTTRQPDLGTATVREADLDQAAALAGLDPEAVGRANLERAVSLAMGELGLSGIGPYLRRLESEPSQRRRLCGLAVVQESWLWRDPRDFQALAALAVDALTASAPRATPVFRVLCAPCAGGEEPASAAAALLAAGAPPESFQVDAADANPKALDRARTGRFGPASLRPGSRPPGQAFIPHGEGLALVPRALGRIRFLEADILNESFLADQERYDAVLCRNFLIYLSRTARQTLARTLKRLLAPHGALFAAPAEAAALAELGLSSHLTRARNPSPAKAPPLPSRSAQADTQTAERQGPVSRTRTTAPPTADAPADQTPTQPGDPAERARTLADAGRLPEALAALEQALKRHGHQAGLHHLQGTVLSAMGRRDEACQALRRAVYLEPGHAPSLRGLHLLLEAQGGGREADLMRARADRAEKAWSDQAHAASRRAASALADRLAATAATPGPHGAPGVPHGGQP